MNENILQSVTGKYKNILRTVTEKDKVDFFENFKRFYDGNYIMRIRCCSHKQIGSKYIFKLFFDDFKKYFNIKDHKKDNNYTISGIGWTITNYDYLLSYGLIKIRLDINKIYSINYINSLSPFNKIIKYEELTNYLKSNTLITFKVQSHNWNELVLKPHDFILIQEIKDNLSNDFQFELILEDLCCVIYRVNSGSLTKAATR
jgi:hypothetical protein